MRVITVEECHTLRQEEVGKIPQPDASHPGNADRDKHLLRGTTYMSVCLVRILRAPVPFKLRPANPSIRQSSNQLLLRESG